MTETPIDLILQQGKIQLQFSTHLYYTEVRNISFTS